MASSKIKGITVEIGGDTSKLGKALEKTEKQSKSLQGELKVIDKLLKFDPNNTELLAQKQEVLTKAVGETSEKLNILKEAEAQVIAQFERGDIGEDQLRSFQREIIKTESELKNYSKELDAMEQASRDAQSATKKLEDTIGSQENKLKSLSRKYSDVVLEQGKNSKEAKALKKEIDKLNDELEENKKKLKGAESGTNDLAGAQGKAGDSSSKLSGVLKGAGGVVTAAAGAVAGAAGAFLGLAESTREYREDIGKLGTAFETAGISTEAATEVYKGFFSVLGEEDRSVEAVNHLAKLVNTEEDLYKWTDICAGVWGTFGDSLPIEGLTEASNETAKTGQLTGVLADALNWAGVSEDEFQASLDKCATEQERSALITDTLNGLYKEASDNYKELNGDVMDAQRAQSELTDAMAGLGAVAEPVSTALKFMGADMINSVLPGVESLGEGFTDLVNGVEGSGEKVGAAMSELVTTILTKIVEIAPQIIETGLSLVSNLIQGILTALPMVVTTAGEIVVTLLDTLGTELPNIVLKVVEIIPMIITALINAIPSLLEAAITFLSAIIQAIPEIITALVTAIPTIVTTIITGLVTAIPLVINGAIQLLMGIIQAIPVIITSLVTALPTIVSAIVNGLINGLDAIINGAVTLLMGIIQAIPQIITALVVAIPTIVVSIVTALLENIPVLLIGAFQLFMALVQAIPMIIVELVKMVPTIVTSIISALSDLPDQLSGLFGDAWERIKEVFTPVGEFFSGLWENIKEIFSVVGDWFKDIFSKAWEGIKFVFTAWYSFYANLWAVVKKVFSVVGDWFKSIFTKAWTNIKNVFSAWLSFYINLWNGVKNVFSGVGEWFRGIFSTAWSNIKAVFSNWASFFGGLWNTIKDKFSKIGTSIAGAISSAVKSGINGVISSIETTINKAIGLINGAIDIINLAPGVDIGKISKLKFPRLAQGGIIDRPTFAEIGEDGREAVIPLERNTAWIDNLAHKLNDYQANKGVGNNVDVVNKLDDIYRKLDRLNQSIVLDTGELVGATINKIDQKLATNYALKARGI